MAYELMGRAGDALDRALEDVGVYVEQKSVVTRDQPSGPQAALFINAVIGRVAFSERVQRPDQEAVDAVFDELAEHLVEDEYERRRRALGD